MPRYFEDFSAGDVERFGHYEVTRAEVLDFASRYDPQPFHLDDAAAQPVFGRLAASGWHTASMCMRMMVDHWAADGTQSLGSPGVDGIRWLTPVHPGDSLRVEIEWQALRRSRTRPDRGIAQQQVTVFNQHDVAVMRFAGTLFLACRSPAG